MTKVISSSFITAAHQKRALSSLDTLAVLADINGTVFAPKDFKEHCQLATSTGVVPQSKLIKHFKKYSVDMLTSLMSYLELAVPIDDIEVLKLS